MTTPDNSERHQAEPSELAARRAWSTAPGLPAVLIIDRGAAFGPARAHLPGTSMPTVPVQMDYRSFDVAAIDSDGTPRQISVYRIEHPTTSTTLGAAVTLAPLGGAALKAWCDGMARRSRRQVRMSLDEFAQCLRRAILDRAAHDLRLNAIWAWAMAGHEAPATEPADMPAARVDHVLGRETTGDRAPRGPAGEGEVARPSGPDEAIAQARPQYAPRWKGLIMRHFATLHMHASAARGTEGDDEPGRGGVPAPPRDDSRA